jgi:hypothetical protein
MMDTGFGTTGMKRTTIGFQDLWAAMHGLWKTMVSTNGPAYDSVLNGQTKRIFNQRVSNEMPLS